MNYETEFSKEGSKSRRASRISSKEKDRKGKRERHPNTEYDAMEERRAWKTAKRTMDFTDADY